MYSDKELAKKGFIPASQQAALSSPHKPPISCSISDYAKLPPKVRTLYKDEPQSIGRFKMHHLKNGNK